MTASQSLLLVAGDPSGDLHGSHLIEALKRAAPRLEIAAVGGPLMRARADEFIFDLASLGVAGFWEPVRQLPVFLRLGRTLAAFMARRRPRALVCIDFYGFNRRVLASARRQGVPTFYYISPQVWASRPGRVRALKRLVDRMMVIFPFEEKLYRDAGIPVTFVGHPLLDLIPKPVKKNGGGGLLRVGLLPGSRGTELKRHLPVFIEALSRIRKDYPNVDATVFASPHLPDEAYAAAADAGLKVLRESGYATRSNLDLAITSSGTATLENALLGIPMVVAYKMSWPTYAAARALVRVPYISMANLLAGKALVPELIQRRATPARLAEAALKLLEDPRKLERMREDLAGLRRALGGGGAADRAAGIVLRGFGSF